MKTGFVRYFLILSVFLFCGAGPLLAGTQQYSPYDHSVKSFRGTGHNSGGVFGHQLNMISRAPSHGNQRRSERIVACENEVQEEECVSSRRVVTHISTFGIVSSDIFQSLSGPFRGVYSAFNNLPYNLSQKVYLVIQVFRI